MQLGPGACISRVPNNGRTFEYGLNYFVMGYPLLSSFVRYVSGEDPFLGYTLVQPVVKGIQSQGVIANAKHYVNNNQVPCVQQFV